MSPIAKANELSDLATFVPVFMRLDRAIVSLAERMFWIADDLGYHVYRFCHITTVLSR